MMGGPPRFRYGSGARSSSRRRDGSRDRDRPGSQLPQDIRANPAGPMERQEWMDALEDVKTRISAVELQQRNYAGRSNSIQSDVAEIANKVTYQEKLITDVTDKAATTEKHLIETCDNIVQKFATLAQ